LINNPFSDLVVIELASVLAGPAVGMFFSELGAKVIKVENPKTKGDMTRSWKHPQEDPKAKTSAYYHAINWNKESRFLDLSQKTDYESLKSLIKTADILISNYLPQSADKLKVNFQAIKDINPSIIYASVSAYGIQSQKPGFDALMQAETGWMHMNGSPNGPPIKMPVALIDILAGHQLKQGILTALILRFREPRAYQVSVSLYDAALSALANQASNYLNLDVIPQRKGSQHPNIAPYGDLYLTKDNYYLISAIGTDKQFKDLLNILQLSTYLNDLRFMDNTSRVKNRTALNDILKASFKKINGHELLLKAEEKSIPIGRINNLKEVFESQQAQALILKQLEKDGSISRRVKTNIFKIN